MLKQTAILIFANTASKEIENKAFLSKEVVTALNNQTLQVVKKTGIPFFHFSEKEQFGNSFGERFTNAIATIFAKGYAKVITVGNDTPHLKVGHLKKAATKLENTNLVLGLSRDGGFYLMGITKEHFCKNTFLHLPWQKRNLTKAILKVAITKNLTPYFLEYLYDVDAKMDVKKVIHSFRKVPVRWVCFFLLLSLIKKVVDTTNLLCTKVHFNNPFFNKGSPLIFVQ